MRVNKEIENKLLEQGYKYIKGLEPVVFKGAKTLILGSLPGQQSLNTNEYYAKKGNRFWPMMEDIFHSTPLKTYADKKALLKEHSIALWDVYYDGYRKGSKDGYKYATVNDIKGFLKKYPTIKQIVIAGKDAQKSFDKLIGDVGVSVIPVTSTSQLNGSWKFQKHQWYDIDY